MQSSFVDQSVKEFTPFDCNAVSQKLRKTNFNLHDGHGEWDDYRSVAAISYQPKVDKSTSVWSCAVKHDVTVCFDMVYNHTMSSQFALPCLIITLSLHSLPLVPLTKYHHCVLCCGLVALTTVVFTANWLAILTQIISSALDMFGNTLSHNQIFVLMILLLHHISCVCVLWLLIFFVLFCFL